MSLALFALIVVIAWLAAPSHVHAQEQGQPIAIEGRVVNATPGGGTVEGVAVMLHLESVSSHTHFEALTDEQGRFRIENISYEPMTIYGVSALYQGGLYGTDLDLSAGAPPPLELTVFDATSDESVFAASSASALYAWADQETRTVSTLEIVNLVNRSDRAYVPDPARPMSMVRFGLPPGARNLAVESRLPGADFIQVDRGFALVASVPPGAHEISYTYQFPYTGAGVRFDKSFNYGAGTFRAMAPFEVMGLSSEQLGGPSSVTIGEREWQLLEANGIAPGTLISLQLDGLPQPSFWQRAKSDLGAIRFEYVAPVALVMLMAGVVAFAFWRRRRQQVPATVNRLASDEEMAAQEGQVIRRMLRELEDSYRAGGVAEDDYRRRRRVLTSRLASISRS